MKRHGRWIVSAEQRDITRARDLGARAFLVKPPKPQMLTNLVAAIERISAEGANDARVAIPDDLLSESADSGRRGGV